jgi:signal transduction histidine kinase
MDLADLNAWNHRWTSRLYRVGAERTARELPLRATLLGQLLAAAAGALALEAVALALAGASRWTLFWAVAEPALLLAVSAWWTRRRQTLLATPVLLVGLSHTAAFSMGHFGLRGWSPALLALTILVCGLLIGAYFVVSWTAICTLLLWLVPHQAPGDRGQALGWTAIYVATAFLVILFSRHLERLVAANSAAEESQRGAVVAERTRFAREIHDTLAQGFTGIVVQLNAAEACLGAAPEAARDHLEKARALARQSLDEARRSVRALRPGWLANGGLLDAMAQIGQQLTADSGIQFESRLEGDPYALSEEVEMQLLRIGQEALTNAVRHGRPRHIELRLRFEPRLASLEVSDDGDGIGEVGEGAEGVEAPSAAGCGLRNMKERARMIGGELVIQTGRDRGTRIIASVPSR